MSARPIRPSDSVEVGTGLSQRFRTDTPADAPAPEGREWQSSTHRPRDPAKQDLYPPLWLNIPSMSRANHKRLLLLSCGLYAAAVNGCSDAAVPTAPVPESTGAGATAFSASGTAYLNPVPPASNDSTDLGTEGDCDYGTEDRWVQECSDPVPPGDGGEPIVFINSDDRNLYEAAGDPSPGSAGVWLGSGVSPSVCFIERQSGNPSDSDADGLANNCEFPIARSFAPRLWYHDTNNELCPSGEPYWAIKRFPNGVVRAAYMFAYHKDCRTPSHYGDSEMVVVEVTFNATTRHWEFRRMWTSAHYGADADYSEWNSAGSVSFDTRYKAYPHVWVAAGKHANYRSRSYCETGGVYTDECASANAVRFPVYENANTGSRHVDLIGPVPSRKYPYNSMTETFYSPGRGEFRGWNPNDDGVTVKSYYNMLFGYNFEYYWTGDGFYTDY